MAPELSENLSTIRNSAAKIKPLSDQVTEKLRALDSFFLQNRVDLECWPWTEPFEKGGDISRGGQVLPTAYYLGFGRCDNGIWALAVRCEVESAVQAGVLTRPLWTKPLSECSRHLRLGASAHIVELIAAVAEAAIAAEKRLQEEAAAIRELTAEIDKAQKDKTGYFLSVDAVLERGGGRRGPPHPAGFCREELCPWINPRLTRTRLTL